MSVKSKYAEPIANYDPAKHGTIREYCDSLGLDYLGYRKAAYAQRKKAGLPSRKMTNNKPYYEELMKTGEPVKAFCERKGLVYQNFKMGWYRYRKARGLIQERKGNPAKGKEPMEEENEIANIFTGESDFYELKEKEN